MDVAPKTLLFFFTHSHSLHFFYLFIYFFITMLSVPKTLLFFFTHSHSLHFFYLFIFFHHYAQCSMQFLLFLLCDILLYSVFSRCKTLPLYFLFYFLFSSSFLCFATLILISQTLFDLCTLQKPLRENPKHSCLSPTTTSHAKNPFFLSWFHSIFSPLPIEEDPWAKTIKFFIALFIYRT